MKDKKAAKILIKRAKKHPELYSEKEVYYAKMVKKRIKQEKRMQKDTLKIQQNKDGSFTVDWVKNDPEWKWLNKLTSKEIQTFVEDAVKYDRTIH